MTTGIASLMLKLGEKLLIRFAVRKNVAYGRGFHVGPGSVVWAPVALNIGKDVYIGKNVTFQVDGLVGDNVLVGNNVGIVGRRDHESTVVGIPIRNARWVGNHPKDLSSRTVIGSDVWIGYGTTILSGVHIGNSSIIAADSLVLEDVPENSIVAGSPARRIKSRFTTADFEAHWNLLSAQGIRRIKDK